MKAICLSDLHGNEEKYMKLAGIILQKQPEAVFIAGDLLPNYYATDPKEFIYDFLAPLLSEVKKTLSQNYPPIFTITGNDDPAAACYCFEDLAKKGLIIFANNRAVETENYKILGYPYIPPTPFLLKDWEKYDVSMFTPRDCVSPEAGIRTVEIPGNIKKYSLIKDDLKELAFFTGSTKEVIGLFHSPPNDTNLDKIYANSISGVKCIQNIGSIAIRRYIEKFQPLLTIHGHVHESADISGSWADKIGKTFCYNASNNGNELAVIELDTEFPERAIRTLL